MTRFGEHRNQAGIVAGRRVRGSLPQRDVSDLRTAVCLSIRYRMPDADWVYSKKRATFGHLGVISLTFTLSLRVLFSQPPRNPMFGR